MTLAHQLVPGIPAALAWHLPRRKHFNLTVNQASSAAGAPTVSLSARWSGMGDGERPGSRFGTLSPAADSARESNRFRMPSGSCRG